MIFQICNGMLVENLMVLSIGVRTISNYMQAQQGAMTKRVDPASINQQTHHSEGIQNTNLKQICQRVQRIRKNSEKIFHNKYMKEFHSGKLSHVKGFSANRLIEKDLSLNISIEKINENQNQKIKKMQKAPEKSRNVRINHHWPKIIDHSIQKVKSQQLMTINSYNQSQNQFNFECKKYRCYIIKKSLFLEEKQLQKSKSKLEKTSFKLLSLIGKRYVRKKENILEEDY